MKINEFIQQNEGHVLGSFCENLYKMLISGFLNNITFKSESINYYTACMGTLVLTDNYTKARITLTDNVLNEIYHFKFELEGNADDDPVRYREVD